MIDIMTDITIMMHDYTFTYRCHGHCILYGARIRTYAYTYTQKNSKREG